MPSSSSSLLLTCPSESSTSTYTLIPAPTTTPQSPPPKIVVIDRVTNEGKLTTRIDRLALAMMRGDEYYQQQPQYYRGPRGAPHGLLMAVVLGLVVAGPLFLGDGAVTEAVADLLGPTGLLLLPVALILVIRVLSSDRGAAALADALSFGGSPDSVHRVGGSPVGVALALILIAALLYYRTSLFGGGDGDDE